MIYKIPDSLQQEIDRYFNLHIGGKTVVCPYYINPKMVKGNLRVMSGKGTPEEIELEVKVWAKVRGFDLKNASAEDIREFLLQEKIGIDCSGLVANTLNNYMRGNGFGSLLAYLKFRDMSFVPRIRRFLRPIENIGANTITGESNTLVISDLNDIRPGDLIRAKGRQKNAHHVAMVTEVEYEPSPDEELGNVGFKIPDDRQIEKRKVIRFKYVNSHRYYESENGMRYGEVFINNPDGTLKDQDWHDDLNGRNYFMEDLLVDYEDNGIRRLRFAEQVGL